MKPRLISLLLLVVWLHSAAVTADEYQSEQHIHAEQVLPDPGIAGPETELARLVGEQTRDLASLEAAAGTRHNSRARRDSLRLRREILDLQRQALRGEISPSLLRVGLYSRRERLPLPSNVSKEAPEREVAARIDAVLREVFAASRALPRQTFAVDGWPSRETLTIPVAPIRRIQIDYAWAGLGTPHNRKHVIEKTRQGNYALDTGITVDAGTIESLALALTALRPAVGSGYCYGHTDDYPNYEVTVEFESGDRATISSHSNCFGNIPWNVYWQDRHYVQYGTDLAEAVHTLLHKLDPEYWMTTKFPLHQYSQYHIRVFDTSGSTSLTPEERMEAESYLALLSADPRIAAFLDSYDLVGINLHCWLTSENPDCSRLNGKIALSSHDFDATYELIVEINATAITRTSATRLDLDAVNRTLREGGELRRMLEDNPTARLHVDFLGLRDEPGMTSAGRGAHAVFRAVHPNEVTTAVLVRLPNAKSPAHFLYLPEREEIWVTYISLDQIPSKRDRTLPSLDKVMALFDQEPGAVAAIRELVIHDCSRLIADFDPRFLETHSGYILALEQVHPKITRHKNRISVWGYCFRVEEDGRFAPVFTGDAR